MVHAHGVRDFIGQWLEKKVLEFGAPAKSDYGNLWQMKTNTILLGE